MSILWLFKIRVTCEGVQKRWSDIFLCIFILTYFLLLLSLSMALVAVRFVFRFVLSLFSPLCHARVRFGSAINSKKQRGTEPRDTDWAHTRRCYSLYKIIWILSKYEAILLVLIIKWCCAIIRRGWQRPTHRNIQTSPYHIA